MTDLEEDPFEGEPPVDLHWMVLRGEVVLSMLRRVAYGEDPDWVFAETWANAKFVKSLRAQATLDEEEDD